MAITGVHTLLYSSEPEALRELLRDVFGFEHVDAGDGWLIFRLPPAELGVHPAESAGGAQRHQLSFLCDDLAATIDELRARGLAVDGDPRHEQWGSFVTLRLPGEVGVMLYEARHPKAI